MAEPQPTPASGSNDSRHWNDFNPIDLRILDVRREGDVELAAGDVHRDALDVGVLLAARFDEQVQILELVPGDVEGKYAQAGRVHGVISFREVKFS
jgi:hypothetical protein